MVIPFRLVVRNISFEVDTLEVGKLCGIALYNADKTLALESGAQSTTTTGLKTKTITAVTLEPGTYWFAWTADGTTFAFEAFVVISSIHTHLNKTTPRTGTAANSSSSAVFPATLGTITGDTDKHPVVAIFEP